MTFNYRERDIRQTATVVSVDAAGAPNASKTKPVSKHAVPCTGMSPTQKHFNCY